MIQGRKRTRPRPAHVRILEPPKPEQAVLIKMSHINGEGRSPTSNGDGTHAQTDHEESPGPDGSSGIGGSSGRLENGSTGTLHSTESEDDSKVGKVKRCLKTLYKVTSSLIGLIILLIVFSFIGALIFMKIESTHEEIYKVNITLARDNIMAELLAALRNGTSGRLTVDKWQSETEALLIQYEARIMDAFQNNVKAPSTEETWDFWSSLFFSGTVYTTIGYGHMAPVTDLGRLICMLYAAIGIPLALVVLAALGKRFTLALKFLWAFVRRYYYTGYCRKLVKNPRKRSKYEINMEEGESATPESRKSPERSEDGSRSGVKMYHGYEIDDEFNLPISVAIAILLVYILLGGFMYSLWEEWTFVEAFYFVFISISTIGFGDVVPAHPKFFIISSVYIFIGLSLVSMCVNVAIEFFSETAQKAKEKMTKAKKQIGKAKRKVAEASRHARDKMIEVRKQRKNSDAVKGEEKSRSHSSTPAPPDMKPNTQGSENTYDEIHNVNRQ